MDMLPRTLFRRLYHYNHLSSFINTITRHLSVLLEYYIKVKKILLMAADRLAQKTMYLGVLGLYKLTLS